jgi:hypothetical protein
VCNVHILLIIENNGGASPEKQQSNITLGIQNLHNFLHTLFHRSWDTVIGIATRLRAGRSGICVPAGARDFSLQKTILALEPHPASCSVGSSAGVMRSGRDVDNRPSSGGVKNTWRYTSYMPSWRGQ